MDLFDLESIKLKVLRSIYYLSNARLYTAIEIACLDIQGKAAVVPVHQEERIPLATNVCRSQSGELGPAVRVDAVDIILSHLHYWEGPRG